MKKKKNYVTRDKSGEIWLWTSFVGELIMNRHGEWIIKGSCERSNHMPKETYKEFIGNLPRKGTCREFVRAEK